MALKPISIPTGGGKTLGIREALRGSAAIPTGFDSERIAYLERQMEAAATPEQLMMLGMEEVRRTHRAMRATGLSPDPVTLNDERTGAVICTSDQDDYLERYRRYFALHPGMTGNMR
jgi:hypothetical protein